MVMGTRWAIASDHYLAAAAGHRVALEGGNAIDAAAAMCFCQTVLEQNDAGIGGEVPVLIYCAKERKVWAVSGVGWSPKAFTIDWCRGHGIDLIPGDGYLPAVVPAVVGTWALALQRFGVMSFGQVLRPALELAEDGFPMTETLRQSIVAHRARLEQWPASRELFFPDGEIPPVGARVRNPGLASVFRKMCKAEEENVHKGRIAGIEAARDVFYRGEIAERIVEYITSFPVVDASGRSQTGLLSLEDLAEWRPQIEEPVSLHYKGLDVHKCSTWTQGPVFLQQLAILEGIDLKAMGLNSAEYVHTWLECAKLAFADREAYYGDPAMDKVPFDRLLSKQYAAQRRALIGERASRELRPGDLGRGSPEYATFNVKEDNLKALGFPSGSTRGRGPGGSHDTTHLDAADPEGNMVAATPSGGWFPTSPIIPGLGFALGTRGQMFYLNPIRPNALAPHKRPRATLTPTLVTQDGMPLMAFGMRGGDMQDQVTLQFFLNHVEFGLDLQAALDVAAFWSGSFPSSFYPRDAKPALVCIEDRFSPDVVEALRARGHEVDVAHGVRFNHMGIRRNLQNGILMAGVCSTGDTSYALAW